MKCGFFLDVVVGKSATILKLFSGKDKALLIWWDSFFVLNLSLYAFDGIGSLNI